MANRNWTVQGEISTHNLVANQREYLLPADLLSLIRIEANLKGTTNNWENLKIVDRRTKDFAITNFEDTEDAVDYASEIIVYDESLFFIEPPKNSVTDGLKVYYSKEATALSDANHEPNLPQFAHLGLVYGACMDYAIQTEQNTRIKNFKALYDEIERKVIEYYANRLPAVRAKLTPHKECYN